MDHVVKIAPGAIDWAVPDFAFRASFGGAIPPMLLCEDGKISLVPNSERIAWIDPDHVYSYLRRILERIAPQCPPPTDLVGICTQIDNALTGARLTTIPSERLVSRELFDDVRAQLTAAQCRLAERDASLLRATGRKT